MILYLPYYFSSKLKTKLLIISVKYFLPRIFLKTKDLKWSYFHTLIFRFIGEEWLFWWKEGSLCFYLRMKTTGVYFHSMKHYEKEDFFIQQILPKENPFFDSQFSKYNFEEQIFTTSYLVIFVQKGIKYLFLQEAKIMKNGHSSLVLSRNLIWSIHVDYFSVPQWAIIRSTFHFSKRSFYLEIQNMCLFLWFLMFPKAERRIWIKELKKFLRT